MPRFFQIPSSSVLACLVVLLLRLQDDDVVMVQAYITSPSALPVHRHVKWLREMTVDICDAPISTLSASQLSQAPDLMYAWSHVPNPSQLSSAKKKECALAVESLVKRVIDERRATEEEQSQAAGRSLEDQQEKVVATELTVQDYNCLLAGWAQSGQGLAAAERCEQILEQMQQTGHPLPNLESFKTTLSAWRQANAMAANSGRSSSSNSNNNKMVPHRAQRILEWMIRLYTTGENIQALPDADCFDVVLQIWSRSGHDQAPQHAEHLLGVMERLYQSVPADQQPALKPRSTSFNAVLAAWSKSGQESAADRAMAILSFMELLASQGDETVAPDSASYNTVMGAFARQEAKGTTGSSDRARAARKADAILRHAEQAHRNADSTRFAIDTILFNTAMGAWSKAGVPGSYLKARAILDRQEELYKAGNVASCKPDIFGYTSVIASCAAEPIGSHKNAAAAQRCAAAYQVALDTFNELTDDNNPDTPNPNHVTYGAMLKACARLLPAGPARAQQAKKIFSECIQAGCVGEMAVSRFREATVQQPAAYHQLMRGYTKRTLPAEWTRNVVENHHHHHNQKNNHHNGSNGYYHRTNKRKTTSSMPHPRKRKRAEV